MLFVSVLPIPTDPFHLHAMILLKHALRQMRKAQKPFALKWWTADVRQQTGGQLKTIPRAEVVQRQPKRTHARSLANASPATKHPRKNPNHFQHDTINIRNTDNGDIKTVHIRLIESFNDQNVIW